MKVLKSFMLVPFTLLLLILITISILLFSLQSTILKPYSLSNYLSEGNMFDAAYHAINDQFLDKIQTVSEDGKTEDEFTVILQESARAVLTPEWLEDKVEALEVSLWDVLLGKAENLRPLDITRLRAEVLQRLKARLDELSEYPEEEKARLYAAMEERLPEALPLEGVYVENEQLKELKQRYDMVQSVYRTLLIVTVLLITVALSISFYPIALLVWSGITLGLTGLLMFSVLLALRIFQPKAWIANKVNGDGIAEFRGNIVQMLDVLEKELSGIWTWIGSIALVTAVLCITGSILWHRWGPKNKLSSKGRMWIRLGRAVIFIGLLVLTAWIIREQILEIRAVVEAT